MKKIELFKKIIRECSYDNTYKMAWAKSLVEICSERENLSDGQISLEEIAGKYLKYYWNQTIFFDLIQGSNPSKPPIILTYTKEMIEAYFDYKGTRNPEVFERCEIVLETRMDDMYKDYIKKIVKALKENVSWRFPVIDRETTGIYQYNKGGNFLIISSELANDLKENQLDLYELINYRWGMILETYNSSPRINKKVKIMDEREIKRSSLNRFKQYLDLVNSEHKCFICGKKINDGELSIDHVIPWSYMYSDDIWNLVYVCKSCNSSKSNHIPDVQDIERLKDRNKLLLKEMDSSLIKKNKLYDELKLAIEKDYVNKFWIGSRN